MEKRTGLTLFFIVHGISHILSLAISTVDDGLSAKNYSDKLFLVSIFLFLVGAVSAIASTSRKHYYRHLKETFASPDEADEKQEEYEMEEQKRYRQARIGITVALSGVLGVLLSLLIMNI